MDSKQQNSQPSNDVSEIVTALNTKAQELLEKSFVTPWKQELSILTDLITYVQYSGYCIAGGRVAAAGMMLLYLRSSKVLSVASGCSALALFILGSTWGTWKKALIESSKIIDKLSWNHQDQTQFSSEIKAVFEKTS
ncbi:MAG: hypothetical protein ACRDFB_06250, partial [Rhabdochlamydiaceae bacterium]